MNTATHKLFKNSLIFVVANFGTKIFSFIMVAFYTYVLTTSEYGTVDLITTTITLLLPIVSFYIQDGAMRFSMDADYDNQRVFSSSVAVFTSNMLLVSLFLPLLSYFHVFDGNLFLFFGILLFQGYYTIIGQFVRGIGKVGVFAFGGVLNTALLLVTNILFLFVWKLGIFGYLFSLFLSNLITTLFFLWKGKLWTYFDIKKIDSKTLKDMLRYCLPLVPNSLMWWIMSMSDRYMIVWMISSAANGLYAVANKLPSILNMVTNIFFQAWQITVIEEEKSQERNQYYSKVFHYFSILLLLTTSGVLLFAKPVILTFISNEFALSWKYLPPLAFSVVFSSFSSFLGSYYSMLKKTRGALITTIVGGILNIACNFLLIPKYGINGAAIATMISMFVLWLTRLIDTKKYVRMNYRITYLGLCTIFLIIQTFGYYQNGMLGYVVQIGSFFVLFWMSRKELKSIFIFMKQTVRRKRNA